MVTRSVWRVTRIPIVTKEDGTREKASVFVPPNGRAIKLTDVKVTGKLSPVPAVVLVKRKNMKEAWCLATSLKAAEANDIVRAYSRRFSIEETFRDTKDITFGLGLRATHIRDAKWCDRLLLLIAIAHSLLTLLEVASEASGLDRTLKTNTSPKRTMSLFNQGAYRYSCLPNMRDDSFNRLMTAYERIVREHMNRRIKSLAVFCASWIGSSAMQNACRTSNVAEVIVVHRHEFLPRRPPKFRCGGVSREPIGNAT